VIAKRGPFFTIMKQSGYDKRNASGAGNIRLVTPMPTHGTCPACGIDDQAGAIGVLNLKCTRAPEPSSVLRPVGQPASPSRLAMLFFCMFEEPPAMGIPSTSRTWRFVAPQSLAQQPNVFGLVGEKVVGML
jgi:hypothetical protein